MRRKLVTRLCAGAMLATGTVAMAAQPADPEGSRVYGQACAACHGPNAQGVPGSYPRLKGRAHRIAKNPDGRKYLVAAVHFGLMGQISVDGSSIYGVMPPHPQLSDREIAAVLNYLDGMDANRRDSPFTRKFVHGIRDEALSSADVSALRKKALSQESPKSGKESDPGNAADGQTGLNQLRQDVATYQGRAKTNYQLHCAGCHGFDGISPTPSVPYLKDSVGAFVHLKRGRRFLVRVPGVSMSLLSDHQTANVLNWLLLAFSADQLPAGFQPYTSSEVSVLRKQPLTIKADQERAEIVAKLRSSDIAH